MIHPGTNLNLDDHQFVVQCPRCEEWHGPYSARIKWAEHYCTCGTKFAIDIDDQRAGEILP